MVKEKTKKKKAERKERRFLPRATSKPRNVKLIGGAGATVLGVGAWAQFGRALLGSELPPYPFAPWVLAAGAALFGVAVWMGSSGEPAVRVGAAGLAVEKGELRRMPWHAIKRIGWDNDRETIEVKGDDETGKAWTFTLAALAHPQAIAWLLKEGRDRIPKVVDVPDEPRGVPAAQAQAGEVVLLDPVQVVGKHCAESDRVIAYEPDARVCPKCERVYHKHYVPDECPCGASLAGMRVTDELAEPATKEAASKEKEEIAKEKEEIAKEREAIAKEKEAIAKEKEAIATAKEEPPTKEEPPSKEEAKEGGA